MFKVKADSGKELQDGKENQHSTPLEGMHLIKTYAPIRLRCYWYGMYHFVHSVCTFMLQVSILEEFTKNDHWTDPAAALFAPALICIPLSYTLGGNCLATRGHSTWGRFTHPPQTCSLPGSASQATQRLQMHVPPWSPHLWMQCCALDNQCVHPQTNGMTKHFNCTLADMLCKCQLTTPPGITYYLLSCMPTTAPLGLQQDSLPFWFFTAFLIYRHHSFVSPGHIRIHNSIWSHHLCRGAQATHTLFYHTKPSLPGVPPRWKLVPSTIYTVSTSAGNLSQNLCPRLKWPLHEWISAFSFFVNVASLYLRN